MSPLTDANILLFTPHTHTHQAAGMNPTAIRDPKRNVYENKDK